MCTRPPHFPLWLSASMVSSIKLSMSTVGARLTANHPQCGLISTALDTNTSPPRLPFNFVAPWAVFTLTTFLLVGGVAQMLQLAWGLWFSEIILLAGLTIIGFQVFRLAPREALGLRRFDARSFGLGFALGTVNYFAWAVPLMALAQVVFPQAMVLRYDSSQIFDRASTAELVIVLLSVSLAAPIGEEIFFRGFLQRALGLQFDVPRAVVVSAFIFSAFHLDPVGLVARFELGVLFGLLAWRSGSLWPAIAAHSANNLVSSVLFMLEGEDLGWWVPIVMCVIGNVVLFALARFAHPRLPVAEPMALIDTPFQPIGRLFLPWAAAGLASIVLLLALDFRGVQLNLIDAQFRPSKELKKREDVKALRMRVRSGENSLQDYEDVIRAHQTKPEGVPELK